MSADPTRNVANAGASSAADADVCHPFNEITRCSDNTHEPMPGSSKPGDAYVLLEHGDHWGHDILDGEAFGPELTSRLKQLPGLYLIRRVGRAGHGHKDDRIVYLVFCREQVVEMTTVSGPEDILAFDMSGPGKNASRGAVAIDDPVLLICTHAKRDMCCALKGRPMAKALTEAFPDNPHIWESSHTKGHRFAPSMVLFPWAYSFGRLNIEAAKTLVTQSLTGEMFLPGNRGRGIYSARGQVAELAVAAKLSAEGYSLKNGELTVDDSGDGSVRLGLAFGTLDQRTFEVELEKQEVQGVISSCGDAPKTGSAWVATRITELTSNS